MRRFLIVIVFVMAGCKSTTAPESVSHLIISFQNTHSYGPPRYVVIFEPRVTAPMQLSRDTSEQFEIPDPLSLISFRSGKYTLSHLNFGSPESSDRILPFPNDLTYEFKPDRVYYVGDIVFSKSNLHLEHASATLNLACKRFYEVLQKPIVVIYSESGALHELEIRDPCKPAMTPDFFPEAPRW